MSMLRLTFVALLPLLLIFSGGCHRAVPVYARVTGMGVAEIPPDMPPPPGESTEFQDADWSEGVLLSTGYGAPPENAVNRSQARQMARQAAKLDALRNLAEQLNGVRIDSETTVRDFITEKDEIRTRVEGFISGAELVSEGELDDGAWEVKMRLALSPLAELIQPPGSMPPQPREPALGPVTPAQARLMAERAAKLDAYRQLLEYLKGVAIDSTTTVEDFMTRNDRIRSRVEGVVRDSRVVDRRFNRDGSVEVDLVLEHPDITQVVK